MIRSGIDFTGATTTLTVDSSAVRVGVDCGHCTGTWDWASLVATGGTGDDLVLNDATVGGPQVNSEALYSVPNNPIISYRFLAGLIRLSRLRTPCRIYVTKL